MFIDPDEYIIIMDMNHLKDDVPITLDEMRMLKSAGVKTLYYQAAIRWDVMQPSADAPIDWSVLDTFIENMHRAGLKALIPFVYSLPKWKPDDFFYSRQEIESCYGVPNYGNSEVAAELDELLEEVVDRYSGDSVQVIYAIPGNGEFALHLLPNHNRMDYPMELFTSWVVDRQFIMHQQHNEIWTAYHPYTDPLYWYPVYNALFSRFPFCKHYGIIFTYVQHSGRGHVYQRIEENQKRGMTYYGGTEYIQGIRANVPILKERNVRMFTAPKHDYQEHRSIEPWMLEEIEWAIGQYES